jgi:hypothetical protein
MDDTRLSARESIHELIDTLGDEDVKKVYSFLLGVFYSQDPDVTYYYGRDGELWKTKTV